MYCLCQFVHLVQNCGKYIHATVSYFLKLHICIDTYLNLLEGNNRYHQKCFISLLCTEKDGVCCMLCLVTLRLSFWWEYLRLRHGGAVPRLNLDKHLEHVITNRDYNLNSNLQLRVEGICVPRRQENEYGVHADFRVRLLFR